GRLTVHNRSRLWIERARAAVRHRIVGGVAVSASGAGSRGFRGVSAIPVHVKWVLAGALALGWVLGRTVDGDRVATRGTRNRREGRPRRFPRPPNRCVVC